MMIRRITSYMAPEPGADSGAAPKPPEAPAATPAVKPTEAPAAKAAEVAPVAKVEAPAAKAAEVAPVAKAAEVAPVAKASPIEQALEAEVARIKRLGDEAEARHERSVARARLSALRRLGADPDRISDDDLLTLAPKVDPDDPDGLLKLHAFKESRKGLFRSTGPGPQERLGALKKKVEENKALTPEAKARRERMMGRLMGGE